MLGGRESGLVELAFKNSGNALFRCSLDPQEVTVTVQSIRTAIQVGDIAGDHLLMAAGEMPFRKMNAIGKLDNLPQKIRARAKALDDSGNLLPS